MLINVLFNKLYFIFCLKFNFLFNFFSKLMFNEIKISSVFFEFKEIGYNFLSLCIIFTNLSSNKLPAIFRILYKYRQRKLIGVLIIKNKFYYKSFIFKFLIAEFFYFFRYLLFFKKILIYKKLFYIFIHMPISYLLLNYLIKPSDEMFFYDLDKILKNYILNFDLIIKINLKNKLFDRKIFYFFFRVYIEIIFFLFKFKK